MTTIQIVSDLHIEQYEDVPNPLDFITPSADILILAGDIGSFYRIQQLIDFLKALCSYFKIVFRVCIIRIFKILNLIIILFNQTKNTIFIHFLFI